MLFKIIKFIEGFCSRGTFLGNFKIASSDWLQLPQAIVCQRRPRSPGETRNLIGREEDYPRNPWNPASLAIQIHLFIHSSIRITK